ncbi:hypothetical protein F5878DRAFT_640428 [Lentinula raphanica]|uniref:Uncharacterized protein n=1 Tax=Lentinula raphanica TaxID=153919 RepID=A0AA38UJ64_9AGAR|nr:hypothetical protein F5880DRAFT_1504315 [Lentinula raphanica]KAJ3840377.1 hypothetical protein F5878DRAFT_640428 [Lentinula raphanica]
MHFKSLVFIVTAVSFIGKAHTATVQLRDGEITSKEKILEWIATTSANLTFIGDAITKRDTEDTMVVYCNTRTVNVCGGACTVYNGGATCLSAPNTNCLSATNNVGFCDHSGCGGSCNQLSTCGVHLDDGFCYTPGTKSINVGFD